MTHPEKLNNHIHTLEERFNKLDQQIKMMESVGSFEDLDIHHLKKQRLALMNEIEQLKQSIT